MAPVNVATYGPLTSSNTSSVSISMGSVGTASRLGNVSQAIEPRSSEDHFAGSAPLPIGVRLVA
jgi:hypothetical protein